MENITQKMVETGQEIASMLITAHCQAKLNRLGGCKEFDLNNYPNKYQDLILAYVNDEITSVTAIYIAMDRERV